MAQLDTMQNVNMSQGFPEYRTIKENLNNSFHSMTEQFRTMRGRHCDMLAEGIGKSVHSSEHRWQTGPSECAEISNIELEVSKINMGCVMWVETVQWQKSKFTKAMLQYGKQSLRAELKEY